MVSLGVTCIHLASLNLTYLTWTPLKPQQITLKTKLAGPTRTGVQGQRRMRRITQKLHQDMPEHIETQPEQTRTHPASQLALQEFMEALKSPNQVAKSSNRPKGTPSQAGPLFKVWKPSDRSIIVSRAHTQLRIARTNETKRFPGCLTPQPPII